MEDILEVLGQAVFELDIKSYDLSNRVQLVLSNLSNSYIPIAWPESQKLMELDWFNECILDIESKIFDRSSSTYLVPISRYLEFKQSN